MHLPLHESRTAATLVIVSLQRTEEEKCVRDEANNEGKSKPTAPWQSCSSRQVFGTLEEYDPALVTHPNIIALAPAIVEATSELHQRAGNEP